MKAFYFKLIIIFIYWQPYQSQTIKHKPKLIVGIVVDQMRNDFIYRYWDRYSEGGFKRIISNGYYFKNAHYNYIPTYTAPGHCSIYTGATPKTHGIIANEWFDKKTKTEIYCVYDSLTKPIGTQHKNGQMSPKNQLSSTIGDELRLSSNKKSKVYGVALKDRSSILPAGHAANAAFWFDESTGNFVSSSWYINELPTWLKQFNDLKKSEKYLSTGWNTLYPIQTYSNSIEDNNNYESIPNKQKEPVFPYNYTAYLKKNKYGIIKATPFGNSLTKDIALECIKNESLGKDEFCDLISISFSSTDILTHAYGPRSVEVEDVYLRLDNTLEEILNFLDKEVGKENYTLFLTADHGGADVPNHLKDNKIPAGYIKDKQLVKLLKNYLQINFNDSTLLQNVSNEQVFLNEEKINSLKLNKTELEKNICEFLISQPGISEAYPSDVIKYQSFNSDDYKKLIQNGYKHTISGNVAILLEPAWMDFSEKGTTHGSAYNYDTHIPIVFYGSGIKQGECYQHVNITQIAPTISEILEINQPNGCVSQPLNDKFIKK